MDTISDLVVVAIRRGIKAFEDTKLPPGQYPVDSHVRVIGQLKVGEPHPAKIANDIPWQRLCCLLLDKLNATTAQATTDEVIEAFLRGALSDELKQRAEAFKPRVQGLVDRILGVTRRTVSGAVTGNIVLMPVGVLDMIPEQQGSNRDRMPEQVTIIREQSTILDEQTQEVEL